MERLNYLKNIFNQLRMELDSFAPAAAREDKKFTASKGGQVWSDIYFSYMVDRVPQKLEENGNIKKAESWYATKIEEVLSAFPYLRPKYDAKDFTRGLGLRGYSFKNRKISIRK